VIVSVIVCASASACVRVNLSVSVARYHITCVCVCVCVCICVFRVPVLVFFGVCVSLSLIVCVSSTTCAHSRSAGAGTCMINGAPLTILSSRPNPHLEQHNGTLIGERKRFKHYPSRVAHGKCDCGHRCRDAQHPIRWAIVHHHYHCLKIARNFL